MKSAIAIRYVHFEDLGTFEQPLRQAGFDVHYIEAADGKLDEAKCLAADILFSLGGPIGAYEDDAYPMLKPILAMLERRIAADLPTVGICLGAQLLSRALGAHVYPGAGKEIGWSPIRLTEFGAASPLRNFGSTPVLHWHGDTFDLPHGGTLLASTERYANQAFSFGHKVLGLQFHPEVTARGLERWFIGHACEIAATSGIDVPSLRAQSTRFASELEAASQKFLVEWLGQCGIGGIEGAQDVDGRVMRR